MSRLFTVILLFAYSYLGATSTYRKAMECKCRLTVTEGIVSLLFSIVVLVFMINLFIEKMESVPSKININRS
jgi:Ca2+/Na+ antiporter